MNQLKATLSQLIAQAANQVGLEETADSIYPAISYPPNPEMGDFAFPCFPFARVLRKAPQMIAESIGEALKALNDDSIADIQTAGGFLNIKLAPADVGQAVAGKVLAGSFFDLSRDKAPRNIMIEYSQPNTHKILHVGHMRNICLGDSLIKLAGYAGEHVVSATFPGDMGTHVAKCLWYYLHKNQEAVPEDSKGAFIGQMYAKGNLLLEDEKADPEKDALNQQQLSAILSDIESEQGETFELWKETRQWSIDAMQQMYDWAQVNFDQWYWESEVDVPSMELIRKLHAEGVSYTNAEGEVKPVFKESQGAIIADLEDVDLGICVLIKSDGHGLYATKDIELARRKFEDHKIEQSVYVVDQRQAHHFKQVFEILKRIGYQNAENCYHLQYNYVELPDGAMSSRKGTIVPLMDLVENMKGKIQSEYASRDHGFSKEELVKVSDQIARGAIKYGMLKIDPAKKIVFDMDEWLRVDGNSGVYIQYTFARIQSMLAKFEIASNAADWALLDTDAEKSLMVQMADFNDTILSAARDYKPNLVCNYLYELCKRYNSFYNSVPIGKEEDTAKQQGRLMLSQAVGVVLRKGMSLMGIESPEKM